MVARGSDDYMVIGRPDEEGLASDYAIAERDNYEYLGREGGARDAMRDMWGRYEGVIGRTGPSADYSQADQDMARVMGSRDAQSDYLNELFAQTDGGWTPQQAQIQDSTAQSIAAQRSLANSGRGFGAMTMAGQMGNQRAAQLEMLGARQLQMQRAQDMATARDMTGAALGQMQQQDAATRGSLMSRAFQQAQLTDEQRRRNDEMARFYLNERYRIGNAQLGANMAYEAQDAANRAGYSNLEAQAAERRAARDEATQNALFQTAGTGAAFTATQLDKAQREDSGYSGGINRRNPY